MQKKILVCGVSGMLGHTLFRYFKMRKDLPYETVGTLRNPSMLRFFPKQLHESIYANVDFLSHEMLVRLFKEVRPDVVINCIGVIKQLKESYDPLVTLPINSLLPHRLSELCELSQAKLIHISTDCVFSGTKGAYVESDRSDVNDLYGLSKFLGEVKDASHAITLRTSIIGHELNSHRSLIDWFLKSEGAVKGYTKALYSGLPAVHLSKVIAERVIPNDHLSGLWHVSASAIDKCELLRLVSQAYDKNIVITPDDTFAIDRTLDSSRFQKETGYIPPSWRELVSEMKASYEQFFTGSEHVLS